MINFVKMKKDLKNRRENIMKKKIHQARAWIIDVNMGYGHQRTAYPLKSLAPDKKIIHANDYKSIPAKDRQTWEMGRKFYEFISRFKRRSEEHTSELQSH